MPITDDTAALVAAQLTVALCSRIEPVRTRPDYTQRNVEEDVRGIYQRMLAALKD